MSVTDKHKDTLSEIREIMSRSSRLTILSGMSGISAGFIALLGGIFVWIKYVDGDGMQSKGITSQGGISTGVFQVMEIAVIVLIFAAIAAIFFSLQKAKKLKIDYQSSLAKRVMLNFVIFLVTGGMFSFILAYYGVFFLVASAMLVIYGLALLDLSKFTYDSIRNLGLAQIILGIIAAFVPAYSLLIWIIGFGVLHIVYGALMHFKYERQAE